MKLFIAALIALSSQAFAGQKFICVQTDGDEYSPAKMILTQIGNDEVKEGKTYAFQLEVYTNPYEPALILTSVNVRTEDVMMRFTNTAKKVSGMIYLDEMDQTWLHIGAKKFQFNCN